MLLFALGISIGIYAYSLFFLGLVGLLTSLLFSVITVVFLLFVFLLIQNSLKIPVQTGMGFRIFLKPLFLICGILLLVHIGVNVIGVLGPEIAFDALWYHLTLPKLYISHNSLLYVPGGLLYYSTMPKLVELLFIPALVFGNEIVAKGIHFLFGILTSIALYKVSRMFFSSFISFLTVLIFYTNLVIGWESITAYTDLARAFYATLAVFSLLLWYQKRKRIYVVFIGIFIGLEITTKLLGVLTLLGVLVVMIFLRARGEIQTKDFFESSFVITVCSFIIPLPWLLFSFIHTGNPFYPFFSPYYGVSAQEGILNPEVLITDFWKLFVASPDPIHPIYLITLPLVLVFYRHLQKPIYYLFIFSLVILISWYILPRTGGGRYVLPYLPIFSLLVGAVAQQAQKKEKFLYKILIGIIIFYSLVSVGYRGAANAKFLPVIFRNTPKSAFLEKNLNFSFGDFYDIDGAFTKALLGKEKVLLIGFHNLYYIDVQFSHESWAGEDELFSYIATQNTELPKKIENSKKFYEHKKTGVKVYKKD